MFSAPAKISMMELQECVPSSTSFKIFTLMLFYPREKKLTILLEIFNEYCLRRERKIKSGYFSKNDIEYDSI